MASQGRPLSRTQSDLDALDRDLERHWQIPHGTLTEGCVVQIPSASNKVVVGAGGGVVLCQDSSLAQSLSKVVAGNESDPSELPSTLTMAIQEVVPAARCSLDVLLYWHGPLPKVPAETVDRVEMLRPCDVWPDEEDNGGVEHVFAVREESKVVGYAYNVPQLHVDDHWVHAVGAGTEPDYRGRGYGKALVSALVQHIASEGGTSLWNCNVTNTASLRLALSCGFREYLRIFQWDGSR